jgi:hypothetical protein
MNPIGLLLTFILSTMLLRLPRSWAPLPLLIGASYITLGQALEIGPVHLPTMRVLILVGLLRVKINGERAVGGMRPLDRMMIYWAVWDIVTLAFHKETVLIARLGLIYDALGIYYLIRVFVRDLDDVRIIFKMCCVVFVPLTVPMMVERLNGYNPLNAIEFGGAAVVLVTKNHFRAQGAFGHPILAGTAGAICLPMALYLWPHKRMLALIGVISTLVIVYASGSSGPIMTILSVVAALFIWKIRGHLRIIRWLIVLAIIGLDIVMNDPVYYLIARIDITGGSTGWYRAHLMQFAAEHLDQWWLIGTDSTRGWTPVSVNKDNSDITSHYLISGVWGGLPMMFLFIAILFTAFASVGRGLKARKNAPAKDQYLVWTLGCILFGHATAGLSVSFFDQSIVFFHMVLAMIGSIDASPAHTRPVAIGTASRSSPIEWARSQ